MRESFHPLPKKMGIQGYASPWQEARRAEPFEVFPLANPPFGRMAWLGFVRKTGGNGKLNRWISAAVSCILNTNSTEGGGGYELGKQLISCQKAGRSFTGGSCGKIGSEQADHL
jgi:hypothetical protein